MSSAPYASHPATIRQPKEPGSGALAAVVAMLLGLLVAVLGFFALLMWIDARNARDDAEKAASSTSMAGMPGMTSSATGTSAMTSYAGASPANADAIAAAHKAFPATLPPVAQGAVTDVNLVLKDITVQ